MNKSANHPDTIATPGIMQIDPVKFTAILAHEVRNPLTNINLSVKMLEYAVKDKDLKKYFDIILRSSKRINDLITELLTCQQAEEALPDKHSIHQLLDEVIEITKDGISLKNVVVVRDYEAQDYKMTLNKPKMIIALTNIIINAIDAMNTKNGELKLVTRSYPDKYLIQIVDNGCGINKENLKHIFKPFFTKKQGGLGLGLAAVQDILKSNNVGLQVESDEGMGTRFTLSFQKKISLSFSPNIINGQDIKHGKENKTISMPVNSIARRLKKAEA